MRGHLRNDVKRLTAELKVADGDLHDLMRDAGDGAGNDQADVGSSTFERDQEMTIVNNARDMLLQSQHALERIADGSYGECEICGEPIGKMRLMAFPRATLCMSMQAARGASLSSQQTRRSRRPLRQCRDAGIALFFVGRPRGVRSSTR